MKFSLITISFFLFMLCVTHALLVGQPCPAPVPPEYAQVKPGNVVAAYFASWDKYGLYRVRDIELIADTLTHVMYAFAKPNTETGTCDLHDPWADVGANFEHRKKVGGHFGELLQLKKKYPHLKILLSVGGGTYSKNLLEIAKQGLSKQFVDSAVQLLDCYEYEYEHSEHGSDGLHTFEYPELFDGLDLDWEWSGTSVMSDHVKLFAQMVQLFAQALKKRSKNDLFTCALQAHPKIIESLSVSSIAKYVDWFHIMAYDFGGASAPGVSFNAPICNPWSSYSIDGTMSLLMKLGVSPAKLILGIPLYGQVYDQTQEKIGSTFARTAKTGALTYAQIKELYLDNPDCTKKWHKKSHVPYAYCPHDEIFVSYDDERSVAVKVLYAKEKLLKGVVFWRLSGDDKDHSLVKAAKI
jgi:chitinase